jgi:RHS repeat-associated protein
VSKSGSAFDHGDTISYGYNARSELTNAVAAIDSDYRYAYDFDDIGNRETSSERGTNSVYTANNLNQYTAVDDFTPQFDDDGNQTLIKTSTGIWSVTYNGENRPILWTLVNSSTSNSSTLSLISMSYDRMGRRVAKNNQRFIYDGYLQIANFELSTSNFELQTFIWDPTEPAATRPLVWITPATNHQSPTTNFYTHDGNKNVSEVVASDCTFAAHYEYAPFGAVTTQRGAYAASNPWRFSSEYAEDDTATVYYNYRHYNPTEGRWVYRDLFENLVLAARIHPWRSSQENLYCAVNNRTSFAVDVLGLTDVVSDQEFPGAHQVGNKWWLYVDDGQNGTVELASYTRDDLRDQMRSAAIQLCIYQRDDWIRTRVYEGGFDTKFFVGENNQHSYYYIEGESQIWADNEVNYIGIGMYEAWLGSPKWLGSATIVLWKVLRWRTLPTDGTFYWYSYGYDNFDSYYSQLDKCTCKPKDGSSWHYDESTYTVKRPGDHRNSRFGR